MIVHVYNVRRRTDLERFDPIVGEYSVTSPGERTPGRVRRAIRSALGNRFPITISLYHVGGRAVTGDLPADGTFVAIRSR